MASLLYAKAEELIGQTIGRWTLVSIVRDKHNPSVMCRCQCGTEKVVRIQRVLSGESRSCGCFRAEARTIHGRTKASNRHSSREYWIWNSMKNRCTNPNYKHFSDYGGRGITVCERWLTFANFFEDMGEKPEGMTLERVDNNLGYGPDNCRWADRKTQNRNKRNSRHITANGETLVLAEWAERLGMRHTAIINRINYGWPEHLAVTVPKGVRLRQALKKSAQRNH